MLETPLSSTALVLIDIQNDYFPNGCYPLSGSPEAGVQAQQLLDAFRKHALPIVHIQHEMTGDMPKFFAPGTEGQQIHSTVKPLPGESVMIKHERSSFVGTPLLEELHAQGIETLILAGMQTNVCVQATTRDALKYGFTVIVPEDATAAVDEGTHATTLQAIGESGATIMRAEDLLKSL